jgi:hypothetical protein
MSVSLRNGPYRIVLVNCGKFDFADVELGSPVHLVGPNNVGKTSLIALLQFLYIDDQRKMQFSREMRETRRYYFPGKYSFALFECLTPGGFQVVGVHGLGPVRQYGFERFVYSGRLQVEDYLNGNRRPREPEEAFRRLSLKELKRGLEPKHLRAALTGVGESRDAFLGLVPAQHRNTYYRFRKLFGNVLRLSHVRQEELKQLLLDIYHNEFQQREIDLAKNYASQHERVVHDSQEIQESERALQHRIEEAEKRVNELRQAAQDKRNERKETGRKRAELRKQVQALLKPEEDWPLQPVEDIPSDWETLIYRYERKYDEQRRQAEQVRELLDVIENQTYGRYTRQSEAATVQALREELESIPERERAVEQMWKGIAVGIKKDLQNIDRDLETLKGLVSSLNRDLGRFDISNLASLKLVIVERQQWVRRIRDITVDEEMPLFGSRDAAEEALEAVGRLLQNHPRADLKDLFELTFEVGMPDGSTYRHEHLDAIESNGTTIAIKVLVNLTLLREVLGEEEVQVPFYLDECSSLDRSNLMSIVSAARRMGFVAVLASPDAMDVADRVYYIEEQDDGRVILEPETAMVEIRMRNGE